MLIKDQTISQHIIHDLGTCVQFSEHRHHT